VHRQILMPRLLVMLGLISFGVLMQRLKDGDGIGWAVPIAIALLAGVLCIWHTHSRTAYLTPIFGAGMIVILPRIEPWMARRARWIYVAAVGLFFLGVAAVVGHALAHGNLVDKSLTYRWYYWTGAYRMVQQHPIIGVGWANFGNHYPEVRPDIASEEVQDPHDFLVRFFAELGIVGGLLALAWMMRLWWEMTRPVNAEVRIQNSEVRRRGLSSLAAVAVGAAVLNLTGEHGLGAEFIVADFAGGGGGGGAGLLFLGIGRGNDAVACGPFAG
jgi:O-antigen ligase